MQCAHENILPTIANKKVLEDLFIYNTHKCQNCGALFWKREQQLQFDKWLDTKQKDFNLDFYFEDILLTEEIEKHFIKKLDVDKRNKVIKHLIGFYLEVFPLYVGFYTYNDSSSLFIPNDDEFVDQIDRYLETEEEDDFDFLLRMDYLSKLEKMGLKDFLKLLADRSSELFDDRIDLVNYLCTSSLFLL